MTKKTPKFEALITNAIRRLQAAQGSTASEIARYLNKEYDISGPELRRQIQLTIRRGVNYGILQRSKRGYVTCDHNIPDVDPENVRECTMSRRRGRSRGGRRHRGHSRSRGRKGTKSRAGGRSRAGRKRRLARRGAIRHRRRRVATTTRRRARSRAASKMTRRRVRAEEVTAKRRRRPASANKMPQQEPPSPSQRQQSPGQGQGQQRKRTPSKSPTRSDEYQQHHHHNQQPPQQQRHTCHEHHDDSHLRVHDTPSVDGIEKLAIKCQHPLITKSLVTVQNEFCNVNPLIF
uniref:H15 domain-containing protein n=1 Tax=Trichogramma kaykai TaxID=54128 RepID=A0ABD2WLK7_9HYME